MNRSDSAITWTLATPPGAGAVAIIQLEGDIDAALAACGIALVAVGEVKVRDLMGVDRGVVARFTPTLCQLMPHGGVAVVRGLAAELERRFARTDAAGRSVSQEQGLLPPRSGGPPEYPEARSEVEARALAALARAASPLAVDLLLAQHELWSRPGAASDPARDAILNRLIDPPLVVAVGASNVGKSTLVNALAGRSVSIVADEPGTTRDHVGVMLDLGGLVVRYVDTPGLRQGADELEKEAVAGAMEVAASADLVLVCGDATAPPPELPAALSHRARLTLVLRADLGGAAYDADALVSVLRGQGIGELVALIRERLVPSALLREERVWKFW
jgi:tRNA modification GTPase